ncbi:hypothetical protein [Roseburia sp. 499]|uniref:hypothetical protein n=1 Tax=Roseburia sp. 499 TaxID=1261634 RepID=UPI00095296FD|nr:hypothetical protein [Roseburia sp. 499]WVK70788.1 hypothetical protein BIV20_04445 [Roseburia sp. 499]
MKHVINGIMMSAITFMVIAAVMIISGRSVRKNELEKALEHAAEQTIESVKVKQEITREEFIEMFKENLSMGIESDSEIVVSIMKAEPEKGILSVQAEEEYHNPLGNKEKVSAERTIILEKYRLEKKKRYTVVYKVGNVDYKVYTLTEGSVLPVPANPNENFICWLDETGRKVEMDGTVVEYSRVFTAKMN